MTATRTRRTPSRARPLTGEYLIPAILGGNKTSYAGSLIAQQFTEVHDWPFGSAIAVGRTVDRCAS